MQLVIVEMTGHRLNSKMGEARQL